MSPARFTLERADHDGTAPVVVLRGEIDATNTRLLAQRVEELATDGPVVLDLSAAEYLDSAAFELLDRLLARGVIRVVLAPDSILRRAATIMALPFHDAVDSALADGRNRDGG